MDIGFMIRSLEDIREQIIQIASMIGDHDFGNLWYNERAELLRQAARIGAHIVHFKYLANKAGIDWDDPTDNVADIPF